MVDPAIEVNLLTIISNTHHSLHSHHLMCSTGVRGHAPPEKCQNLRLLKAEISRVFFLGGGEILKGGRRSLCI